MMVSFSDLFTWSYWTLDKSATIRNFGIAIAGFISLFFLILRAISADRSSKASLRQAQAALSQIEISTRQIEIISKQSEASLKQSESVFEQTKLLRERQPLDMFNKAIDQISLEKDIITKAGAIMVLGKLAEQSSQYAACIIQLIAAFVRKEAKKLKNDDFEQLVYDKNKAVEVLKSLPKYFTGEDNTPKERLDKLADFVNEFDGKSEEEIKNILNPIFEKVIDAHYSIPEWSRFVGYGDKNEERYDIQASLDVLGHLSTKYPYFAPFINLANTNLRFFSFNSVNFKDTGFRRCDMRGVSIVNSTFEKCIAVAADFTGAIMKDVIFNYADLRYCNFRGARLIDTKFTGANICGANFINAVDLKVDNFKDVEIDEGTSFSEDFLRIIQHCPVRFLHTMVKDDAH